MGDWTRSIFRRPQRQALLLNDTSHVYHWGCYGTSQMIHRSLHVAGYRVTAFNAMETHYRTGTAPIDPSDRAMSAYLDDLKSVNSDLIQAMTDADLVVVNGEGTLHRFGHGPRALLSLIRIAKLQGKPVHLVNHACFPSGDRGVGPPEVERFYRYCLTGIDRIVVRDDWSAEPYERWRLKVIKGFDCLPLYRQTFLPAIPEMPRSIVLGGASHWSDEAAADLAAKLSGVLSRREPIVFLAGGSRDEPPEDDRQFRAMQSSLPQLTVVRPTSIADWLGWIGSAEAIITGRFHHLIAAATVSTPIISLPGNTAKTDAVATMLGLSVPVSIADPELGKKIAERVECPSSVTSQQIEAFTARAQLNFAFG